MKIPAQVLNIFEKYTPIVDSEIKSLLDEQTSLEMYDMMRYFFGYLDENLKPTECYGGKRFRPGICLLLAEFLGHSNEALGAAAAVEIFHNFTLIHDDIEDNDTMRRGRVTIWKKWGIGHGINTGDTQLILAYKELCRFYGDKPEMLVKLNSFLTEIYQGVAEGQYLDFKLAENAFESDFVTEDSYLEMIRLKSAILVAASAKLAGIVAEVSDKELENLWQYGLNLGYAYQINDDIVSIWGKTDFTGKNENGDIYEHKKTLPVLYLYNQLDEEQKEILANIYNSEKRSGDTDATKIMEMLNEKSVKDYLYNVVRTYLEKSNTAAKALEITDEQKNILLNINKSLVPIGDN